MAANSVNLGFGFPSPGPQQPTPQKVLDHVFFESPTEWKRIRETEQFDFVVIGSGFCALAFIERTLKRNPHAQILVLERGPFFLPEHFQNLPLPYQHTLGGMSETFPWTLSARTAMQLPGNISWQHGMVPFFGGRSVLWSAWCPRPTPEEMDGWSQQMIKAAQRNFDDAERLLNVKPADSIDCTHNKATLKLIAQRRPIYGIMQRELQNMIAESLKKIPTATRSMPAPMAIGAGLQEDLDFAKFSTPAPLLDLSLRQASLAVSGKGAPLRIVCNSVVKRILQQDGTATALDTSQGVVNLGVAKLVMAMGSLPPATLLMNSFPDPPVKSPPDQPMKFPLDLPVNLSPDQSMNSISHRPPPPPPTLPPYQPPPRPKIGERFTAHFITSVVARTPRADFPFAHELEEMELAAIYLAGVIPESGMQYHVQLSVLSDKNPEKNAQRAARYMPDVVATASPLQLETSTNHLVFVCAVLGELDHNNSNNWLRRNNGEADPTTNVLLQVLATDRDRKTWDGMDDATFQMLELALSPKEATRVEYWHGGPDEGEWRQARPTPEERRAPALVHEGSSLWIDPYEPEGPVRADYRPRGVENVYVTGAGLWPKSGSWNPTLTMVALAQDLADSLTPAQSLDALLNGKHPPSTRKRLAEEAALDSSPRKAVRES